MGADGRAPSPRHHCARKSLPSACGTHSTTHPAASFGWPTCARALDRIGVWPRHPAHVQWVRYPHPFARHDDHQDLRGRLAGNTVPPTVLRDLGRGATESPATPRDPLLGGDTSKETFGGTVVADRPCAARLKDRESCGRSVWRGSPNCWYHRSRLMGDPPIDRLRWCAWRHDQCQRWALEHSALCLVHDREGSPLWQRVEWVSRLEARYESEAFRNQ